MVYYFVPDHAQPSWGAALLYLHVHLLQRNGIKAKVVHEKPPFRLPWLSTKVPVTYLQGLTFRPRPDDVLVVPEVRASDKALLLLKCRRLVFVQGSFLILSALGDDQDYKALGYEHALVTLPHMKTIVEKHFGVQARVVPPSVAPYFFLDREALMDIPREKRILTYPKAGYIEAGLPDYDIVWRLLRRRRNEAYQHKGWEVVALVEKSHEAVAQLMRTSAFFVNVNSHEGFNSTVPEAMAAGCISVCYDAFGGQDFLRDGHNAFVFPNNYAYPLLDKLIHLIDGYEQMQDELSRIRMNAYATACRYTETHTERELLAFYRSFLGQP